MSTSHVIICKPVRDTADPLLDLVEKTYISSFPENERRDFFLVRELLADDDRFELYALLKDGVYAGFITSWLFEEFVYVEHFAIDESARNGGIGAKAMNQFLSLHEVPVVLEVEIPDGEMSKRRIGFYERLGFTLHPHVYHQPPYREGEGWLEMRLMTHGNIPLAESFEKVKSVIHQNVYGIK